MSLPSNYEIARPHPRELAALPAIEVASAAMFPPEDLAPQHRATALPRSFFEQAASAGRLWVARTLEPAVPVGFAAVIILDGTAHLHEMDVLPVHGRQGLGRALVLHVARWARASGFAFLTLTTFRHLPWNAPFYARLGFLEIADGDQGPELQAARAEETELGFDPDKRVAMRLDLHTIAIQT